MALKEFLVLRCLAKRGLEGRMALIQPLGNSITASFAGVTSKLLIHRVSFSVRL
jgi:hypothetical protein